MSKLFALAALLAPLAPLAAEDKKVPYTVLKECHTLRVKEPVVLVIKDADAYAKRADELLNVPPGSPTPALPKVDFDTKQLVVIGWGAKPSTVYDIAVVSVTGTEKETIITVKTTEPNGLAEPAITYPVVAVVLPKAERVKIVVTGDRAQAGKWWKDFADSKGPPEVVVKK